MKQLAKIILLAVVVFPLSLHAAEYEPVKRYEALKKELSELGKASKHIRPTMKEVGVIIKTFQRQEHGIDGAVEAEEFGQAKEILHDYVKNIGIYFTFTDYLADTRAENYKMIDKCIDGVSANIAVMDQLSRENQKRMKKLSHKMVQKEKRGASKSAILIFHYAKRSLEKAIQKSPAKKEKLTSLLVKLEDYQKGNREIGDVVEALYQVGHVKLVTAREYAMLIEQCEAISGFQDLDSELPLDDINRAIDAIALGVGVEAMVPMHPVSSGADDISTSRQEFNRFKGQYETHSKGEERP